MIPLNRKIKFEKNLVGDYAELKNLCQKVITDRYEIYTKKKSGIDFGLSFYRWFAANRGAEGKLRISEEPDTFIVNLKMTNPKLLILTSIFLIAMVGLVSGMTGKFDWVALYIFTSVSFLNLLLSVGSSWTRLKEIEHVLQTTLTNNGQMGK